MLPDIPLPRAPREIRERNERRTAVGIQDRCVLCEAPLVGKLIGLNIDLASDRIMDPKAPYRNDSGVVWVGATCARKVPADYRIAWESAAKAHPSGPEPHFLNRDGSCQEA